MFVYFPDRGTPRERGGARNRLTRLTETKVYREDEGAFKGVKKWILRLPNTKIKTEKRHWNKEKTEWWWETKVMDIQDGFKKEFKREKKLKNNESG